MGLSISSNGGVAQAWSQDSDSDFAGSGSSEPAASEPQLSRISQQAMSAYGGQSVFDGGDDDDDGNPGHSGPQTGPPRPPP
jgi:hypothetical protein